MSENIQTMKSNSSNSEEEHRPDEFIIDPLLALHTEVDDVAREVEELKQITQKHTDLLSNILEKDSGILKEARDRRPEGKVLRVRGIAPDQPNVDPNNPSGFFIIDTNRDPGHKIRAYTVFNPGPNNLYVGFNAAFSPQVDVSAEDLVLDDKFDFITPGQETRDAFDTKEILSIHIRADPATGLGPNSFRAKLIW